jgi:hypothetical protein
LLLGAALGPVATGLVSDGLQPRFGAMGLGYALALMSLWMPVVAVLLFIGSRELVRDLEA